VRAWVVGRVRPSGHGREAVGARERGLGEAGRR
jgi:hypothetical protein